MCPFTTCKKGGHMGAQHVIEMGLLTHTSHISPPPQRCFSALRYSPRDPEYRKYYTYTSQTLDPRKGERRVRHWADSKVTHLETPAPEARGEAGRCWQQRDASWLLSKKKGSVKSSASSTLSPQTKQAQGCSPNRACTLVPQHHGRSCRTPRRSTFC